MAELIDYLNMAQERNASDFFLVAGAPVTMKVDGVLYPLDEDKLLPPRTLELIRAIYGRAERSMERLLETGDDDFSLSVPGLARFRVNAYKQRGSLAAIVRVVAFSIPDWHTLRIPESVMHLAELKHGMVLVTGSADCGKSTTLACIVDRINHTRSCHVITMEDPIEFLHRDCMSIVSQREISIDTRDFPSALRACLRQAPDVIQLGEMRDPDTIQAALTAAETGHLLLATLHTRGAVNTIDRIIDTFPAEAQQQVRIQLSMVLDTVASQQLIPDREGNLVPAFEIMHMNSAIRSMVREGKTHQINNAIASGASEGMVSMDQSILALYREGTITRDTALLYAMEPDYVRRRLN